jgi:hypothetical protein
MFSDILKTLADHMVVKCDTNFMNFMRGVHCVHCFIYLIGFILLGQMYNKKCVVLKSFIHLTLLKVHNMCCYMF